jgi:PTS system ascorbate-specific IIC component
VFDVLVNDVLSTPAILIGLFVLIGNLLLKRSMTDTISGTFKTIIGFTLLDLGAGIAADTLNNFSTMFTEAFGLQASVMNTDAYGALLNDTFRLTPIIMIVGMILNLVIAKFTRFKYIYLTGQITLYMAGTMALVFHGFHPLITIIGGSVLLGIYMAVSPALLQKYTANIIGSNDFGVASSGSISYFLAAKIGEWFGDKEKSTEDIKVPQSLGFLQDSTVSMSLTMSVLFIFISFFTGSTFIEEQLSNGQNYLFFSFMQGITFAAGIQVLLTGITMAIDELIPAFRGIAERLIDGAIPSLDAPVMAKYSPNAMIIGFLSSLAAGVLGMFLLSFTPLPVIIPGMLQHFFIGGVGATYANSTGGRRGAIIAPFITGLLMAFLPSIFLVFVGNGLSDTVVFGDTDLTLIGILLKAITQLFQ